MNGEKKNAPTPESASQPNAETRLKQLQDHFALAERTAGIGYWRHEVGAKYPTWSPGFYALLEVSPDEVKPSTRWLMDRMHPDDRDEVAMKFTAAMTHGIPFHYRTRGFTPNGQVRLYDTYGDIEYGPNGEVVAVLGVVQNVTEKVAAETALRKSEADYRFMAEEASDVLARHSADGKLVFVSAAVKHILGYEPADMIGGHAFDNIHADDVEAVRTALEEAVRSSRVADYTVRVKHKAGHYLWLESHLRFIMNPSTGEVDGAISVSRDVTARKAVEEELTSARERAEAASQTKTRFLANMSHELRTPLNAIIGFSDILSREMFGALGCDRYQEYAKLINESGTMLLELINDLLDMSKIEAGKFELHYEDFLASDPLTACVRLVGKRAEEKGIALIASVDPQDLRLRADQRGFKQILLNLLSNAIKFTNKGGTINVSVTKVGNFAHIVVRDTGIGIAAAVLPRLGQPFEQASSDASRLHGGSGLGLALVKSLVRLHGGELKIASEEGRGTEVTATIPIDPRSVATRAA